jgi:hypothetical protein
MLHSGVACSDCVVGIGLLVTLVKDRKKNGVCSQHEPKRERGEKSLAAASGVIVASGSPERKEPVGATASQQEHYSNSEKHYEDESNGLNNEMAF